MRNGRMTAEEDGRRTNDGLKTTVDEGRRLKAVGDGRRTVDEQKDKRRLETDVDEHGRTMSGRTEEEDDGEPMYSVEIINVSHG